MKKIIALLLTAIIFSLAISSSVIATDSPYCDFSVPDFSDYPEEPGARDVTLNASCVLYEEVNGVASGNLTLGSGVSVVLNRTLVYAPGKQINIPNTAYFALNTNGSIVQAKLCIKDLDSDGYADVKTTNLDPYTGDVLSSDITMIDMVAADQVTNLCPENYRYAELMNHLAMVDADPTTSNTALINTSDRELLRLGFTLAGITDALAAVGDIQIIDRNLLLCNTPTGCPTVEFSTPTTGNIYTIGKIGIGVTNPGTALDVTGVGRFSTGLTLTSGALNLTSTSGAISATALGASTISTTSNNLTLSTVTSGTLALTSAGALNLSAGAASTVTLASAVNSLNFDANTLTIDASNNRVGIGTSAPSSALHVSSGLLHITGSGTPASGAGLEIEYDSTRSDLLSYNRTTPGYLPLRLRGSELQLYSGSTLAGIDIDASGNVGIGTALPGKKLDVIGQITVHPSGTNGDNQYHGSLIITKPTASGQYINLIRDGTRVWSIGTVYNNSNFGIGDGNSTDSSFVPSFVINTSSDVGIGTTAPESRLQVTGGGLCVGSDASCNADNDTEGVVYSSATAMTVYDVAENYPTKDLTLVPEEVVELDDSLGVFVKRASSPYSSKLLGIISAEPAVHLGGFNGNQFKDEHQVAVALTGRVPVKIDPQSPPIKIGDLLTASPTAPGKATKATQAGFVIGKALTNWSPNQNQSSVMVFVNSIWYNPDTNNSRLDELERIVIDQQKQINNLKKLLLR